MKYVKERPSISYWGKALDDDAEKIFTYKSDVWEYEQEERVVKFEGGSGPFPYEPELLVSVVAGSNISDENFKILSASVKKANRSRITKINLYRAEIDFCHYRLNIPGFKRKRTD